MKINQDYHNCMIGRDKPTFWNGVILGAAVTAITVVVAYGAFVVWGLM